MRRFKNEQNGNKHPGLEPKFKTKKKKLKIIVDSQFGAIFNLIYYENSFFISFTLPLI